MWKSLQIGLIAGSAVLLFGSVTHAATIDYIFTGTCAASSCSLNGTDFTSFTVTEVGSTLSVSGPSGGEYTNATTGTFSSGALSANLTGTNEVLENTASPGFMGFLQTAPGFADETMTNTVFETYNLTTPLGLTAGGLSVANNTYTTSGGNLVFGDITSLNFGATVTPLPAALPLFAGGLGLMALIANRRKRKTTAITA
jgi:hypothetical protein